MYQRSEVTVGWVWHLAGTLRCQPVEDQSIFCEPDPSKGKRRGGVKDLAH